jgi:Glycosyltransferase family 87
VAHWRSLWPLAALAGVFGLYGWAVFAFAFRHDGVIGPRYNAPGSDFMVYYGAARAALEGRLALVFDGDRFTQFLNAQFAAWLRGPLSFHPFVYPPHALLLMLPLGLLPFGASYAAFLALTFAALVAATWVLPLERHRWAVAAALALCPAASITAVTGQNAFLTAALLVGGAGLAAERPVLAGTLLGVLTYKPQFWLMAPVALAAARQGRALAAMAIAASLLVVASIVAFGLAPWRAWLGEIIAPSPSFHDSWRAWSMLWGEDVYACAALLGAPDALAKGAQLAVALGAAGAVAWSFARPVRSLLRIALLLAAACLASPHLQGYDTVLLALAAMLFLADGMDHGLHPGDAALALVLFVSPIFNPPRVIPLGFLTPPLEALFIVVLLRRTARGKA